MLRWIVWRDLMLAWRRRADMLSTVFFFVIVVSLFPLGIGPETQLLRTIAPGVVWVAALLASMLSLGTVVCQRLSGRHAGAVVTDAAAAVSGRAGKDAGALDRCGSAAGVDCAAGGSAIRSQQRDVVDSVCEFVGGHADFEFDWIGWSGIDAGTAWWRRFDLDTGVAALHSGADLRRGRG